MALKLQRDPLSLAGPIKILGQETSRQPRVRPSIQRPGGDDQWNDWRIGATQVEGGIVF